jgi:D-glycero-alpha-D-manno-heptose 1-phosphate guanylyltransferase
VINTAIILAGGLGSRLKTVIADLPKPMAPVNEKPFLDYQFRYLKYYGIKNLIISTGYLSEKISSYYGNEYQGLHIQYSNEEKPLGTGGGIRLALEKCEEPFTFVLNGDSFFDINLSHFSDLHFQSTAEISLAGRKMQDASRFGTIITDDKSRVTSFREKDDNSTIGMINGGVYIIDRNLYLNKTSANMNFSIEKDFFEKQLHDIVIKAFEFNDYFIDIGIPEDYLKAQNDFKTFKY